MEAQCYCAALNAETEGSAERVGVIADKSPECACEQHSMSADSPGVVLDGEVIARLVCVPMHVERHKAKLLPNFFNHAFTAGLSVQRLDHATPSELAQWVNAFVGAAEDRAWLGYVMASSRDIRHVQRLGHPGKGAFCIYDATDTGNPAHAEVCASYRPIEEADRLEARKQLREVFGNGHIIPRRNLAEGAVVALVNSDLLERPVQVHWSELVAA